MKVDAVGDDFVRAACLVLVKTAASAPCPPHTRRRCGRDGPTRGYSVNALATACVAPRLDGLQDEEDEAQEGSRGLIREEVGE